MPDVATATTTSNTGGSFKLGTNYRTINYKKHIVKNIQPPPKFSTH